MVIAVNSARRYLQMLYLIYDLFSFTKRLYKTIQFLRISISLLSVLRRHATFASRYPYCRYLLNQTYEHLNLYQNSQNLEYNILWYQKICRLYTVLFKFQRAIKITKKYITTEDLLDLRLLNVLL